MEETYILICPDSLEGIFTAVYDGWKLGNDGRRIRLCIGKPEQPELFSRYRTVEPDAEKTEKVARTIRRSLGQEAYEDLCYAACSTEEDKGTCIYYALREGLAGGGADPGALRNLKNPYILKISRMRQRVWHEMDRFLGFVRFREMENGILFSAIRPDNPILPLLGPHFADRLPGENWMIYDEARRDALIHPAGKPWYVWRQAKLDPERMVGAPEKEIYADLWRGFCRSISVAERRNADLQRQNLPYKYREHLTEFCEKSLLTKSPAGGIMNPIKANE